MAPADKDSALLLLIGNDKTREYLVNLLRDHHHTPLIMTGPGELLQNLKSRQSTTVFLDCEAVLLYGPGIYSRIKVACQHCRVVLLCDKAHKSHRDIIKEAMEIGVYACLLAPFEGWEVLTMVRHSQAKKPARKRPARKKALS